MRFLLSILVFLLSGSMLQSQPAKIIKVLGDAVAREDRKPLAGKEWLLAVRVEDAQGNGLGAQPVRFSVTGGSGKLLKNAASGEFSTFLSTQTNTNGEVAVFLLTDPSTAVVNGVSAQLEGGSLVPVEFTVMGATGPVAVTAKTIFDQVQENTDKILDMQADVTVTSDAPWLSPMTVLRVFQKGDERQRVEEVSPEPGVFFPPTAQETAGASTPVQEIVAISEAQGIAVILTRAANQADRFPFLLDYVRMENPVVVRREEYLREGSSEFRVTTDFEDFQPVPIGGGERVFVFNRQVSRSFLGLGKVQFTTTSIITNRQINTGLSDDLFQP